MKYVKEYPNIHYLYQENQKHAAARNNGLTIAQGDYVFFCDCDDFVEKNVLGRLCESATKESADILFFNYCSLEEDQTPSRPKKDFNDVKSFENGLAYMSQAPYLFGDGIWQFLIRRRFMEENNVKFIPEMVNREEYFFFLQMLLAAGKVLSVDVDVYYYVQHPTSWVHQEGRVYHRKAFIDCMVVYLEYLTKTRRRLEKERTVSDGLLEAMKNTEASDTFRSCFEMNKKSCYKIS